MAVTLEEDPNYYYVTVAFSPSSVTINVGDTVQWQWNSGPHSVTSGTPDHPSGLFDSEVQPASINAKTEQSTSMPRLRAHAPIEYLHRRPAKLAVFMESFLLRDVSIWSCGIILTERRPQVSNPQWTLLLNHQLGSSRLKREAAAAFTRMGRFKSVSSK